MRDFLFADRGKKNTKIRNITPRKNLVSRGSSRTLMTPCWLSLFFSVTSLMRLCFNSEAVWRNCDEHWCLHIFLRISIMELVINSVAIVLQGLNLHAYRQASELRLNSFFISTTLLSFEQLIHLDYFIWRRVGLRRDGFLVASWLVARWFLGGELVGGETPWWWDDRIPWQGIETIKHTHTIHIYLPFTRKSLRWKSKDVEIKRCENCSSRNLTYKFCTGTH